MKYLLLYLGFFFLLVSCKKDKDQDLPTGNYIGNFYGHTVKNEDGTPSEYEHNDLGVAFKISEVTENTIKINGRDMYRKNNMIEGVVGFPEGYEDYQYDVAPNIRGVWSKEKGTYYIRGGYNAINAVPWSVSGTFEIKSDF